MKWLAALVVALIIALVMFGAGFFWFVNRVTPETIALNQQTAQIKAETEKIQASQVLLETQLAAKITLLDLSNQQTAKETGVYKFSLAAGYAVRNLWFVFLSLAGIVVLYSQKARFMPHVEFDAEGVKTFIPAKHAVELTREALKVVELKHSAQIIALEDDRAGRRLRENVQAMRTLKTLLPKDQAVPLAETINLAPVLPAFSGNVHLSQCVQDAGYEEKSVCFGRNLDAGALIQIPFDRLQSLVKLGLQGQGKSAATLLEIWTAFSLKYLHGENIRLHLIDKHHGFDESLSSRLETLLPGLLTLFDTCLLGPDIADNGALLTFLEHQIKDGKTRQEHGSQANEPLDLIIFDEYSETVATSDNGRVIEEKVKQLYNYRKAKKFLDLVLYESTKTKNSVKGLNPARMSVSKMVFACPEEQAAHVIGWQQAKKVSRLQPGQCALKLSNTNDLVICQLALVDPGDFAPFKRYVDQGVQPVVDSPVDKPVDSPVDKPVDSPVDGVSQTVDSLRELLAQGVKQAEIVKQTGIDKSLLSNIMKGARKPSEETLTRLTTYLSTRLSTLSGHVPFVQ